MRISEFRIVNFKCFQDTGVIKLSPGMNLVVGQNNAGKTALLQALNLKFTASPHRSKASLPRRGQLPSPASDVWFTITISGDELRQITERPGRDVNFSIPPFVQGQSHPAGIDYFGQPLTSEEAKKVWDWVHNKPAISFSFIRSSHTPSGSISMRGQNSPSHDAYTIPKQGTGAAIA